MAAADQILFASALAAVNNAEHIRVYFQDVEGNIRESLYEGKWANGTIKNVIATGKIGSPIAATSKALNAIRVYYVDAANKIREAAYDANRGWYDGDLSKSKFAVAPYSKVAACFLAVGGAYQLRVYVQLSDNTIQEYGYDDGKTGWQKMTNLGAALPGTELACTSFKRTDLSIRVYYQVTNLSVIEKAYDASKGWYTGGLTIPSLPPRAALGCTSFNAGPNSISLRVYYSTTGGNENLLKEKAYDNGPWYDGGFVQHCIPGSKVAVIQWGSGSGLNLRVYFQNGTKVTGVSEWMWIGKWVKGQDAISPA